MTTTRRCFLALIGAACFVFLVIGFQFNLHVKYIEFFNLFRLNNSANGLIGRNQSMELVANNNSASAPAADRPKTVILVYTTFWGDVHWVNKGERCVWYEPEERQCPLDLFEITVDRKRFAESDLVIFHSVNMPGVNELKSLLTSRPTSQRWVYAMWESPVLTPNPSPLNGLFNLTWTYRTDSDFWGPYGNYEPLSQEEMKKNEMASVTDHTQGKSELVAWMVSNCRPQLRLSFVRELKKFIKVDVYGSCAAQVGSSNSCPRGNTAECIRKYKFYLSLENALCEDYITEKYWGRLGKFYLCISKIQKR